MNEFGRIFRISIFGESHGDGLGVIIDGCPAGIDISVDDFTEDLSRRKGGGRGCTQRIESDIPIIKSGVFNNKSTGAPILILFENENVISQDYEKFRNIPRPGHADFTAMKKYNGYNDYRGGGHFSGRITLGLVAAGVIAKKIIQPININAKLVEAGGEKTIGKAIQKAIEKKDSIGGIIQCKAENMPIGLGEPFFDSVESIISHIVFSIPAIRAIEFGAGFNAAEMYGSEHNDIFINDTGKTESNNAGGISGGISNGNELCFRVAVKPTPSIGVAQKTINLQTNDLTELIIEGRHDICIALRVPVIVEAATAIALADFFLINK